MRWRLLESRLFLMNFKGKMKPKSRIFHVAAIQTAMRAGKPEHNVERAFLLIQKAIAEHAVMLVLPELFITGFDYECIEDFSARQRGEVLKRLRSVAREKKVVIVAGSIAVQTSGRHTPKETFNISYVIDADGRIKGHHEKMHLFPLLAEDVHFAAGARQAVVKTSYGIVAPCICFDIRFPELARRVMHLGAEVLAVPAEFPHPRLDHWRTLLRARAIENQFFVVAANRTGKDKTGNYFGHSMIINPYGEVVAEAGEKEEVLVEKIDLEEIESVRHAIPCLDRINPALDFTAENGPKIQD
jgi:omega-amidase